MQTLTYNLQDVSQSSDKFYSDLESFSLKVLSYPDPIVHRATDCMKAWVEKNTPSESRSTSEYLVELLMFGVFWRNYKHIALAANPTKLWLLKKLYGIRQKNKILKPYVDVVRGKLITELIDNPILTRKQALTHTNSQKLIHFMEATGDYCEEAKRLKAWLPLMLHFGEARENEIWRSTLRFTEWFEAQAKTDLGSYTVNVEAFIRQHSNFYAQREDRLLCIRARNEYHLNMFGAQIMNKALFKNYFSCQKKVVLLPVCMRSVSDDKCKARISGLVRECVACSSDCNIGKIKREITDERHRVFIIPHSSDFSRFLRQWQGQSDTALIGVACVPNLIMGGYEMQSLNIPAQCVFLDYCGCQKHWNPENAIATNLNINKLKDILKN